MSVSSIIGRAAKLLWKHRMLAALGILDIVITASGLFERVLEGLLLTPILDAVRQAGLPQPFLPAPQEPLVDIGQLGELVRLVSPYGAAGWIGLFGAFLLVLIGMAVLGIVIEGGIITAVRDAGEGKSTSAGGVFRAGWRRALPMVVIASVPAIPPTVGAILAVVIATVMIQTQGGLSALSASEPLLNQTAAVIFVLSGAILTVASLISLPLALLAVLAAQACMLEDRDAIPAFRRAWSVLRANISSVLLLVIFSYVVSFAAGAAAYLPDLLASLFLPAIVLLWLIHGIARTFYLALWSIGWVAITASVIPEEKS